jgi:putative addiction module component (TIGR02574 family)
MTEAALSMKEKIDALSSDDQCDLVDLLLIHQFDEQENGPTAFVPKEMLSRSKTPISESALFVMRELTILSFEEREQLLEYANHVLSDNWEPDEALISELERRTAEMESGAVQGIPMEEVMEELRKKYP